MEEKLSIVQEQRAKNAELKAKSRALKLKKKAGEAAKDVGVIVPIAPASAGKTSGSFYSDDDPPKEISHEEATLKELYLQHLESSSVPVNPLPLIRSLETFDDWDNEDRKRYFDHLCYEKDHRYLRQCELDFIQTYSTQNPQGRYTRFDE
ncbi:unnamed protein product [Brassica rapa subsp. trilocularis]